MTTITHKNLVDEYKNITIDLPEALNEKEYNEIVEMLDLYDLDKEVADGIDFWITSLNKYVEKHEKKPEAGSQKSEVAKPTQKLKAGQIFFEGTNNELEVLRMTEFTDGKYFYTVKSADFGEDSLSESAILDIVKEIRKEAPNSKSKIPNPKKEKAPVKPKMPDKTKKLIFKGSKEPIYYLIRTLSDTYQVVIDEKVDLYEQAVKNNNNQHGLYSEFVSKDEMEFLKDNKSKAKKEKSFKKPKAKLKYGDVVENTQTKETGIVKKAEWNGTFDKWFYDVLFPNDKLQYTNQEHLIKSKKQKEHAQHIIPKNTADINVIRRFVKMIDGGYYESDVVLNLYKFIEKNITDKTISKQSEYGEQVIKIANMLKIVAQSMIESNTSRIKATIEQTNLFKELKDIVNSNEIDLSVTLVKAYVNIQTSRDIKAATALQKRINNAVKSGALTSGMLHYKEVLEIKEVLQKYIDGKAPNIEPPVSLSGLAGLFDIDLSGYKWKPSKSARREFAQNMKNSEFAKAYEDRKQAKADKRRSTSKFDYEKAGGNYIPTLEQYNFAMFHKPDNLTASEEAAFNDVIMGYTSNEKVHHDSIHVVNEYKRKFEHQS